MNEDKRTIVVIELRDGKWGDMHDMSRRVYSADGIAPTIHTCGGGNQEPKVIVYERADNYGCEIHRR